MGQFEGRQVVVTGGTGALGTAVVRRLVDEGAQVHVPVFVREELERFPLASHPKVRVVAGVDLAMESAVEGFYADLPGLYASIHLAGGFSMARIEDTTNHEFQHLVAMNGTTAFLCSREAVRAIKASGKGGRIVNVAARPALVPTGGVVAYAASKALVAALTQSLAEEVKGDGIWVNAIVPSTMDTPANRKAMPDADFDAWPKLDEVTETIVFLASPANACTRGALVPVYGRS